MPHKFPSLPHTTIGFRSSLPWVARPFTKRQTFREVVRFFLRLLLDELRAMHSKSDAEDANMYRCIFKACPKRSSFVFIPTMYTRLTSFFTCMRAWVRCLSLLAVKTFTRTLTSNRLRLESSLYTILLYTVVVQCTLSVFSIEVTRRLNLWRFRLKITHTHTKIHIDSKQASRVFSFQVINAFQSINLDFIGV